MGNRQRITVPPDNYGRVYIGLLETGLSAYAKLCYGVMWSFGPESWASVPSIGRRMSSSENTVRKAQSELQEQGWIVEAQNTKGSTRHWVMVPPAMLEMRGEPTPPHILQGDLHGVNLTPSPREGVPLHHVKTKQEYKQELNQEPKQEAPKGAGGESPKKDITKPYSEAFYQAYATKYGVNPSPPTFAFVNLAKKVKAGLEINEWVRRLGNYFNDPWLTSHDLQTFMTDWDKFVQRRQTKEQAAEAAKKYATRQRLLEDMKKGRL